MHHAVSTLIVVLLIVTYACAHTAWDLSTLQCTAGDVEILGPGTIINEPCQCIPGDFFNAKVNFTIYSKSSGRYCFSLYLCDAANTTLAFDQVVQRGTATYTFTFPNYPCGAGTQCFGFRPPNAVGQGLVFPKGTDCPTGVCCSTLVYDVNPPSTCPITGKIIPSKCRYSEICIQGRGASIACKSGCSGTCGPYNANLEVCDGGLKKPLDFQIVRNGNVVAETLDSNGNCSTLTVPVDASGITFVGRVIDADGCSRQATLSPLPFLPAVQVSLNAFQQNGCAREGTFTAVATGGQTPITYVFKVNGVTVPSTNGVYRFPDGIAHQFSTCYSVTVSATDANGCSDTDGPIPISQCVSTNVGCL